MEIKKFKKNDQGFSCLNCGFEVGPLIITSRNHCPKCLYSLHVDINPGDRLNSCNGLMEPIGIEQKSKKGIVIIHKCITCGQIKRNKACADVDGQSDDMDMIIKVSVNQ